MAVSGIKLNIRTQLAIRKLGWIGNQLQIVAAESINESAEDLQDEYGKRLVKHNIIRTKFTLNSLRLLKANPIRKSGQPRQLGKINAITGVRKMKGGVKHYLAKLEEGVTQRGNPRTENKVPVPLTTARTAGNKNKPVASPNRLTKGDPQVLTLSGRRFGVRGDRFNNTGRRWGALYKQIRGGNEHLTGNLNRPFFFIGNDNEVGVYKFLRRVVTKIRDLGNSVIRTKSQPHFKVAVKKMSPERIQRKFLKKANAKLSKLK